MADQLNVVDLPQQKLTQQLDELSAKWHLPQTLDVRGHYPNEEHYAKLTIHDVSFLDPIKFLQSLQLSIGRLDIEGKKTRGARGITACQKLFNRTRIFAVVFATDKEEFHSRYPFSRIFALKLNGALSNRYTVTQRACDQALINLLK